MKLKDCNEVLPFVCETKQKPKEDLIEVLGTPTLVIPLDKEDPEVMTEFRIGFPNVTILETELKQSAFFQGNRHSFIDFTNLTALSSINGFTVGMWIKTTSPIVEPRTILHMIKGDQQNGISLFIENDLIGFKMCKDKTCSSHEKFNAHTEINPQSWTYVAVTIDSVYTHGTFFVNETKGIKDEENSYFKIESNAWLILRDSFTSLKIGAIANEDNDKAFVGEISCIQFFSKPLRPAEIYQLSKVCHVPKTYERGKACPDGYFQLYSKCYRLSDSPKNYLDAKMSCLPTPGDSFPTLMAFPLNYQLQEILAMKAKQTNGIAKVMVGLDSESGDETE